MKKLFLLLTITILFTNLNAQLEEQQEYTGFLEQALDAVKKEDKKDFNINLKYFSTAIERDKITPEILTEKNLELYSKCISAAVDNKFIDKNTALTPTDIAFLEYGADNYPKNIDILASGYALGIFGCPQDYKKAYYWYDKALEKEAIPPKVVMSAIPSNYTYCEDQDCIAATIHFLEEWSEKGLAPAMNELAKYYFGIGDHIGSGNKEARNQWWDKSMQWYEKAFEAGEPYEKAQAADGISNLYSRTSTTGTGENEIHWKKEYLSWLEKYVEDFEQNHPELIKNPHENLYYQESLAALASTYQYTAEVKDEKKSKFYKEKGCRNGVKILCRK